MNDAQKASPTFNLRDYVNSSGEIVAGQSANCLGPQQSDLVPGRNFIVLVVRYRQPLLMFGTVNRSATAVVVSQSQEGEN